VLDERDSGAIANHVGVTQSDCDMDSKEIDSRLLEVKIRWE